MPDDSLTASFYESGSISKMTYTGQHGEMFGIWIKNLILSLFTLGIYSFWGSVIQKKYIYQNAEISGGSFDYHATGKQKFIGFLKGAVLIGIFIAIFMGISALCTTLLGQQVGQVVSLLFFYVGVILIQPVIKVGSLRFNRAYTSWNNVRFKFHGNVKDLYMIYIKAIPWMLITLGLYAPFLLNKILNFTYANSSLGTQKFTYSVDGWEFAKTYYIGALLSMVTFGIYGFWLAANLIKLEMSGVTIQGNSFKSDITGGDLFVNALVGQILILVSLGLAFPVFINMQLNIFLNSISYKGELDLSQIRGEADTGASALADGISEAGEALGSLGDVFT